MIKINAKHVNPFVEAAMQVVTQIAGIEVRRGHLSYKAKVEPSFGVSIIIGIYGFLTGQIVYSLDGTARRAAGGQDAGGQVAPGEEDHVPRLPGRGGEHDHRQRHRPAEPAGGTRS